MHDDNTIGIVCGCVLDLAIDADPGGENDVRWLVNHLVAMKLCHQDLAGMLQDVNVNAEVDRDIPHALRELANRYEIVRNEERIEVLRFLGI